MSKDRKPIVSTIIPVYNRTETLVRAVQSVLDQTYKSFEIIIVNDGSTIGEFESIKSKLLNMDERIRVIDHIVNRGASAARNTGAKNARGELLAFLDSDDEWLPEKLEMQVNIMKDNHEVGMVSTGFYFIDVNKNVKNVHYPKCKHDWLECLFYSNAIGTTSTILLSRECFEKVGGFNENFVSCQDWEFYLKIAKKYKISVIKKPLVNYWYHGKSISGNYEKVLKGHLSILDEIMNIIHESEHSNLRRKIYSFHQMKIGNIHMHFGNTKLAKKSFIKSFFINPTNIQSLLMFLLSIFGKRFYDFSKSVYTKIKGY